MDSKIGRKTNVQYESYFTMKQHQCQEISKLDIQYAISKDIEGTWKKRVWDSEFNL